MTDEELLSNVIYEEWQACPEEERHRRVWVMTPDMFRWLRSVITPTPAGMPWAGFPAENMLGRPVVLRPDARGIRLTDPTDLS